MPLLSCLLALLLLAPATGAQEEAAADSTRPDKVSHRSNFEKTLALPGSTLYLPFFSFLYTGKQLANYLWEKRLLDQVTRLLTFADGRAGIRPLSSTQLGSGIRLFLKEVKGADAVLTSTLGASGRFRQHHALDLAGRRLRLRLRFDREPKERFFGVGNHRTEADRTNYLQEDLGIGLTFKNRLNPALFLEGSLGYNTTQLYPGRSQRSPQTHSRFTTADLPGLEARINFIEGGVFLKSHSLDHPGSPTGGNRSQLRLLGALSVDAENFSYLSFGATTEQYFELFYRRTLALRLDTDWRWAPGANRTPFYRLATLGGNQTLRGYQRGRFRDQGVVHTAVTYAFPVWSNQQTGIDGQLFGEWGRAFAAPGDLGFDHWHRSWGAGVRAWRRQGLFFDFVAASSPEALRLIFNFKSAI